MGFGKKILALVLCAALTLCAVGCAERHTAPQTVPAQSAVLPEHSSSGGTEVSVPPAPAVQAEITFAQVKEQTSFDEEAFYDRLAAAEELLELPDAADAVMAEYRALTAQLKDCLTWYTLCDIASYADVTDEELRTAGTKAHEVSVACVDAFSDWLGKLARSPYREAYAAAVGEENVQMYEDYQPLTKKQKKLLDREKALQEEYKALAAEPYENYAAMAEAVAPLYAELVALRNRIAESHGYESYADYAYEISYARDYTPQDAQRLCEAVKKTLAPLYAECILAQDAHRYHAYRNSDETGEEALLQALDAFLGQLSPEMRASLAYMLDTGAYDIAYRSTKFEASFTTVLHTADMPYLYSQPVRGSQFHSLGALVHEFGHYHAYRTDPTYDTADGFVYSLDNIDAAEIHSTGLEMLFWQYLPQLYGNGAPALQKELLSDALSNIVFGCMLDEFQQLVYAKPDLQPEDVSDIFHGVMLDYMGNIFIEDYARNYWALINHNFEAPFYYISYGVSALAAFQIWETAQQDDAAALQLYNDVVGHGCDVALLTLLEECGMRNIFEEEGLDALCDLLRRELM